MRNIAIIPARSGSKGLKDKNIKELSGKPLIWYSVQAAINSGCFDEIMVSTDSEIYAAVARECGASVPFLRSKEAASDTASSWDVVKEVLEQYRSFGKEFDNVMLLQPTSPLRNAEDIMNAFRLLEEKQADGVVGVCEAEHSPKWCNSLPADGNLGCFLTEEVKQISGRQALPTYYRINGAIYLSKVTYDNYDFHLYKDTCYAYCMPQLRSVDIDTELDFMIAETIIRNM